MATAQPGSSGGWPSLQHHQGASGDAGLAAASGGLSFLGQQHVAPPGLPPHFGAAMPGGSQPHHAYPYPMPHAGVTEAVQHMALVQAHMLQMQAAALANGMPPSFPHGGLDGSRLGGGAGAQHAHPQDGSVGPSPSPLMGMLGPGAPQLMGQGGDVMQPPPGLLPPPHHNPYGSLLTSPYALAALLSIQNMASMVGGAGHGVMPPAPDAVAATSGPQGGGPGGPTSSGLPSAGNDWGGSGVFLNGMMQGSYGSLGAGGGNPALDDGMGQRLPLPSSFAAFPPRLGGAAPSGGASPGAMPDLSPGWGGATAAGGAFQAHSMLDGANSTDLRHALPPLAAVARFAAATAGAARPGGQAAGGLALELPRDPSATAGATHLPPPPAAARLHSSASARSICRSSVPPGGGGDAAVAGGPDAGAAAPVSISADGMAERSPASGRAERAHSVAAAGVASKRGDPQRLELKQQQQAPLALPVPALPPFALPHAGLTHVPPGLGGLLPPAPSAGLILGAGMVPRVGSPPLGQEREAKIERRKQSNRDSARRSRLRKQEEMSQVALRLEALERETPSLSAQVATVSRVAEHLDACNAVLRELLLVARTASSEQPGSPALPADIAAPFLARLAAARDAAEPRTLAALVHMAQGGSGAALGASWGSAPAQTGQQVTVSSQGGGGSATQTSGGEGDGGQGGDEDDDAATGRWDGNGSAMVQFDAHDAPFRQATEPDRKSTRQQQHARGSAGAGRGDDAAGASNARSTHVRRHPVDSAATSGQPTSGLPSQPLAVFTNVAATHQAPAPAPGGVLYGVGGRQDGAAVVEAAEPYHAPQRPSSSPDPLVASFLTNTPPLPQPPPPSPPAAAKRGGMTSSPLQLAPAPPAPPLQPPPPGRATAADMVGWLKAAAAAEAIARARLAAAGGGGTSGDPSASAPHASPFGSHGTMPSSPCTVCSEDGGAGVEGDAEGGDSAEGRMETPGAVPADMEEGEDALAAVGAMLCDPEGWAAPGAPVLRMPSMPLAGASVPPPEAAAASALPVSAGQQQQQASMGGRRAGRGEAAVFGSGVTVRQTNTRAPAPLNNRLISSSRSSAAQGRGRASSGGGDGQAHVSPAPSQPHRAAAAAAAGTPDGQGSESEGETLAVASNSRRPGPVGVQPRLLCVRGSAAQRLHPSTQHYASSSGVDGGGTSELEQPPSKMNKGASGLSHRSLLSGRRGAAAARAAAATAAAADAAFMEGLLVDPSSGVGGGGGGSGGTDDSSGLLPSFRDGGGQGGSGGHGTDVLSGPALGSGLALSMGGQPRRRRRSASSGDGDAGKELGAGLLTGLDGGGDGGMSGSDFGWSNLLQDSSTRAGGNGGNGGGCAQSADLSGMA